MIEEKATVIAVEDDRVLLQTQRRSACQSCSVKQGCGTSVLATVVGQRYSQVSVANTLGANVGDEIMMGINDNALVKGSLLIYALPLIFLLVGALLGEFFAHAYNLNAELASIIAGAAGFVLSMFVIRFSVTRTKIQNEMQPHMLRIISKASDSHDFLMAP